MCDYGVSERGFSVNYSFPVSGGPMDSYVKIVYRVVLFHFGCKLLVWV